MADSQKKSQKVWSEEELAEFEAGAAESLQEMVDNLNENVLSEDSEQEEVSEDH